MYNYQDLKQQVFLEENQKDFLKVRDTVRVLPTTFLMQDATRFVYGSSWLQMAYVDRLVELGEIYELSYENVVGQYRMFKH